MMQLIKDNKTVILLAIIAVLLAIIIVLMISGNSFSMPSQNKGSNIVDPVIIQPNTTPRPPMTMPPEMKPKPLVSLSPAPIGTRPAGVP